MNIASRISRIEASQGSGNRALDVHVKFTTTSETNGLADKFE